MKSIHDIFQKLKSSPRLKPLLILFVGVCIFVGTTFVARDYAMKQEKVDADEIIDEKMDDIVTYLDVSMSTARKAAYTMLTGGFFHADIINGDTVLCINEKGRRLITENAIYEMLRDFNAINKKNRSALFVFEPYAFPKHGDRGFAPFEYVGDTTRRDLSATLDFLHSHSYLKATKEHYYGWMKMAKSQIDSCTFISCYLPLYTCEGKIYGAFCLDKSIEKLYQGIEPLLPYPNTGIRLLDKDGNVKAEMNFHLDSDKSDYYIYKDHLKKTPWDIELYCPKNEVYKNLSNMHNVMIGITTIGMLLMLLCFYWIFRVMSNHIRHRGALENDLNTAAKLQMSMLPSSLPTDDRMEISAALKPAKQVGGDLYDSILVEDRLWFIVGDVSGKGTPAALFMTQVCSLFRMAGRDKIDPAEIVTSMNNVLAERNDVMMFCTLFLGCLNLSTGLLKFCNAGHNSPALCGVNGGAQFIKMKPHMAVGLYEDFKYTTEEVQLNHGDTLFVYTDGVNEAKNVNRKMFGNDNLLKFATNNASQMVSELTTSLMAEVQTFENGTEQSDDITILIVRYQ